jgi:putative endonuclease
LIGRRALGASGEATAVAFLERAGYRILARNVRSRLGEIDIVADDRGCLVFVEVRTRRSASMAPEESITPAKAHRLAALGEQYLIENDRGDADWRIDVIAIVEDGRGETRINHIQNAVEAWRD